MDTMHDKDFVAEADKTQLEINPVSGEDVEKLVKEVYATPPKSSPRPRRRRRRSEAALTTIGDEC